MGLDITAYQDLTKLDCVFSADGEPIDPQSRAPIEGDYYHAYINPDFPDQAGGIDDRAVYRYEKSMRFRAGSYGGYNRWREELARLAGYPTAEYNYHGSIEQRHDAGCWAAGSGPFFELICFSDCEGVIGSATAAKLAKDFAEFRQLADNEGEDEYWRGLYAEWQKAFEMAAQNGAVHFH